ncbi:phosphopentomutase [Thermomonas sp.]|uniref:phosphopentomutase n=1 Tax=Thermomonas sp. TaxID=1971895 RepID=UPI00248819C2|nr:phosphopentomutase [Thermomonas sp.]MDI1252386.1 phosphopentomutase [Thermomonas sp.]
MSRAILLVLDSLGIGALPDADQFGDAGADTLGHIAAHCLATRCGSGADGALHIPHLLDLGLGHAAQLASDSFPAGLQDLAPAPVGAWGCARERSTGKDTTSGHWEMCGVPVLFDWGYFTAPTESFPAELLDALVERAQLPGVLGNCRASGTTIIAELGEAHICSGKPIIYTSADSVLQIAAHEGHFGLERLYEVCAIARELVDPLNVARVIARPFTGEDATSFKRTSNRRDYSVPPPAPTLLDRLQEVQREVIGIGKIPDIFAHRGITREVKAHGIDDLFQATLDAMNNAADGSLVFTNFVDFDQEFGHRRDPAGYAAALEAFDVLLPQLLTRLRDGDVVLLVADHGNDPTWPGSDHTREHVPILAFGPRVHAGSIGCRDSFADIGQSIANWLGIPPLDAGHDFLGAIRA